ncbi:putative S-protein [Cardamine amara subsp. amara]|uniref:S-protein homolog n=1 Tax=Cardamine amara subsp. amara TaxID=228776 RepID=A0ABD1ASA2_CARAN
MNRLSCVLLIFGLCIGLSNTKWNEKNSVFFKNSLGWNNVLKVHCISNDDDLGYHFLRPGGIYDFSFHDSGGFIVHYGKKNFWEAKDDGIYFTHGKEVPKLEYMWK